METYNLVNLDKEYTIEVYKTPKGIYFRAFKRINNILLFDAEGYTTEETIEFLKK